MKSLLTANPLGRRVRLILTVAALASAAPVLASPASAALKADSGSASPMSAACGRSGPNLQNGRVNDAAFHGPANQRTGSSTACPSPGVLQPTDDVIYFCWTTGEGGTWTYLQNLRTGVRGWVLDRLLRNNGSYRYCGF
jgi:hypothetical protein